MAGHGTDTHPHGADRLCEAGDRVYSRAVRRGRVPREDAEAVPCLLELALLHPDPDDMGWLVPTSPQEVMTRLLRGVYEEVSASQARVGEAVSAFEWYAGLGGRVQVPAGGWRSGSSTDCPGFAPRWTRRRRSARARSWRCSRAASAARTNSPRACTARWRCVAAASGCATCTRMWPGTARAC